MKLIKKHSIGGVAEAVDSELDKLGTWGKLGVQIVDPTGITGWKDLSDSLKQFQSDGSLKSAAGVTLAALGAIPLFGGFGRVGKAADALKAGKNVLSREIRRTLADPLEPAGLWMARNFTPEMKEEGIKFLENEITKVVDWCKSKKLRRLPRSMEVKVDNLVLKMDVLLDKTSSSSKKIISNINLELKDY